MSRSRQTRHSMHLDRSPSEAYGLATFRAIRHAVQEHGGGPWPVDKAGGTHWPRCRISRTNLAADSRRGPRRPRPITTQSHIQHARRSRYSFGLDRFPRHPLAHDATETFFGGRAFGCSGLAAKDEPAGAARVGDPVGGLAVDRQVAAGALCSVDPESGCLRSQGHEFTSVMVGVCRDVGFGHGGLLAGSPPDQA